VQNCRVQQPSRFIQQTISTRWRIRRPWQHTSTSGSEFSNQIPATWRFRKPGEPRLALTTFTAKITTRRNSSEWSALEKPVAPPTEFLPEIYFLNFVSGLLYAGAGEGI
jgi:hypothetical protein